MKPTTHTLSVPGAELYYEVRGAGPVLLLICGGVYDAEGYAGLADELADRYTVVTYDRRGNSRSPLAAPAEQQQIEVHADDAYRLIQAVTTEPVLVFGNSSGAVIGLALVATHPEQVRCLVAHEPPAFDLLPDADRWQSMFVEIEETFAAAGPGAAGDVLNAALATPPADEATPGEDLADRIPGGADAQQGEPDPQQAELMERMGRNFVFFIGFEVPGFARYRVDFAALKAVDVRPAVGEATHPEAPYYRAALVIANRLGVPAEHVPGDHGGFGAAPAEFATTLHKVLSQH